MKRLISIVAILGLLTLGVVGFGYAQQNYAGENVEILGRFGGSAGTTPVTEVVKVRYGMMQSAITQNGLASGEVVVWDTNSADGYTISVCNTNGANAMSYAGVLVTDILTAPDTTVRGFGRNIGYMAVRGYALASVDTSSAVTGYQLTPLGGTLVGSFGTAGPSGGSGFADTGTSVISMDCGVLLRDDGSDWSMPVWLH